MPVLPPYPMNQVGWEPFRGVVAGIVVPVYEAVGASVCDRFSVHFIYLHQGRVPEGETMSGPVGGFGVTPLGIDDGHEYRV